MSMSSNSIEQKKLEHQLEEWKMLNDYINKIDIGYSQIIVIIISVFGIITTLISKNVDSQQELQAVSCLIFIVPAGMEAVFAYLSYQFRITAILRGHLAALEKKMNREIGENIHMWNSALVETYMARNNIINRYMLLPMFVAVMVITFYCVFFSWNVSLHIPYGRVLFVIYWAVMIVSAVIIIIPFFQNEVIRNDTEAEDEVIKKYQMYYKNRIAQRKEAKFKYEDCISISENQINRAFIRVSVLAAILNLVFSVGMFTLLYVAWWKRYYYASDLRGLETYYAATIGDGIFLSLFLGSGLFFLQKNRIQNKNREAPILSLKAFVVGTALGIIVQCKWLLDKNIELNWTLDRIHHFNIAGIYHAFYFIVMVGLVTSMVFRAIQVCKYKRDKILSKSALTAMFISLMGYTVMLYIDNYSESNCRITIIYCIFAGFSLCFGQLCTMMSKEPKCISKFEITFVVFAAILSIIGFTVGKSPDISHNVLNLIKMFY